MPRTSAYRAVSAHRHFLHACLEIWICILPHFAILAIQMQTDFTSEFFVANRRRLRELAATNAPIVLTANGLLQRNSDNVFAFRQDSNFWYLTGIEEPDVLLVMTDSGEYLIVPGRSASREAFDGAIDHAELSQVSGVKNVFDEQAGWEKLTQLLRKHNSIATAEAAPAYIEPYGMYTNPARRRLRRRLLQLRPEVEVIDLRPTLAAMRMVKQPPELAVIRRAVDVTLAGLQEITQPDNLTRYKYEYEIEADLSRAFRRTGAGGQAFTPIVAGGPRANTFHYLANDAPLKRNELVVMDVGAEYCHYAADITRTIALSKPTARQQAVFDAVLDVQQFGIGLLKPGMTFRESEQQMRAYMGKQLKKLGLIETEDKEQVAKYFPYSSHYMGLDVHDVGDADRPMEPGMVLTKEPGIHILEEGIGIRIEDDILITETGYEVLSAALPAKLFHGSA
jgi:Xaa-Pro aminopeptidase